MVGSWVNTGVSTFAQSGLNEAFGLAIGAGSIGASEAMARAQDENGTTEGMGAVAVAVIGEQSADVNAQTGVIGEAGV